MEPNSRSRSSFEPFRSEFRTYFESIETLNNYTCAHTVSMLQGLHSFYDIAHISAKLIYTIYIPSLFCFIVYICIIHLPIAMLNALSH